jgi:uncharacterized protein YcbK (DUF882 family)
MPDNSNMMTEALWSQVKYFTKNEAWGDWTKLDRDLIFAIDKLRGLVQKPVKIHCAYAQDGHTTNSYHYLGLAVDLNIEGLPVMDQFIAAERFNIFNGIGVYPMWNNPGLHLDLRPVDKLGPDSRWLAIYEKNDAGVQVQTYIEFNWANIKKYCA